MLPETLIAAAWQARTHAYAPYSGFTVGAALMAANGKIFAGSNVENVSLGLTVCAERSAVFAAVSAGEADFQTIAIVADSKTPLVPCGACRQVMAEFAPDIEVISANVAGASRSFRLSELFPEPRTGILDR